MLSTLPSNIRCDFNSNDPSDVLGVDNPVAAEAAQSISNNPTFQNSDSGMNVEMQNVTMVVVDGIVTFCI